MPARSVVTRNVLHRGAAASGSSFDAATTAWVNAVVAAGGAVSATQKTRVNTLIVALKGHGLFSKMDRIWLWAGESDHHQAAIDIVNLGVGTEHGNLTSTGLGASGYTGDGSTGYFDSGFAPGTAGGQYSAAAASTGLYMTTNRTSGGGQAGFGAQDGSGFLLWLEAYRFASAEYQINGANIGSAPASQGGTDGFWALTQLSGTASVYNWSTVLGDSGLINSAANASPNTGPAFNLYFLAFNTSGTPGAFDGVTDTQGAGFIGGGLSSTDVGNLATDLNAYMTAWGVNRY